MLKCREERHMLKKLIEERAELQAQLGEVLGKAKTEERAMDETEVLMGRDSSHAKDIPRKSRKI